MSLSDVERFHQLLLRTAARALPDRALGPFSLHEIRETLLPYRASRRHLGVDSMEDYENVLLRLAAGEGGYAHLDDAALLRVFERECVSPNPDLTLLTVHGQATVRVRGGTAAGLAPSAIESGRPSESSAAGFGAAAGAAALMPPRRPIPGSAGPPPIAATPLRPVAFMPPADPPAPMPASSTQPPITATPVPAAFMPPLVPPTPTPNTHSPIGAPGAPISPPTPTCRHCAGTLPTNREVKFCPHCGANQQESRCPVCKTEAEPGWKHCVSCGATLPPAS